MSEIIASETFIDEIDVIVEVFGTEIEIRCLFEWDIKNAELAAYPEIFDLNDDNELVQLSDEIRDEIDIQDVSDKIYKSIIGDNYV